MQLKPNTLLQGGKYKIEHFINAGGFGCTYEGVHVLLKKRVAIKEFFVKNFCNRDEETSAVTIGITAKTALVHKLKDKFIDEAQFVSTLKSDHIVNVYDVFEENGTAYYVMDYIDGPSLNDVVKEDGPLSEQEALKYILQVADALKYVHSKNRLHLDVKPGNIMIDKDDNAILIDFGTSKQYDEVDGENTSTLLGKTPGYAPLEQMGNEVVKFLPSTDIYSLGATLYKLLTEITPPSASLLASGETLEEMPASISENTRNAVIMSMQINKMKRPQSVDEFVKVLSNGKETKFTTDNGSTITGDVDDESTILVGRPTDTATSKRKNTVETAPKKKKKESETPLEDYGNNPEEALPKEEFGFWLNLFLVIICLSGIGSLLLNVTTYSASENNVLAVGVIILEIMQCVLFIYTVFAFRKRKPDAVFLGKLCVIIPFVTDLVLLVVGGMAKEALQAMTTKSLVWCVVSFIYLSVSKRVKKVIPTERRAILKHDYVICGAFAIFVIYFIVGDKFSAADGEVYNYDYGEFTYTGMTLEGLPEGHGKAVYPRGEYEGEYRNGMRQGKGTFKDKDGGVFVGTFDNNEYSEGKYTQSDGTYYEGTFKNQQPYNGTWYEKDGRVICKVKKGK